jgi:hypothetical protein
VRVASSSNDGLSRRVEIVNLSSNAIVKLEAMNVGDDGSWHTYLNIVKVGDSATAVIDDGLGYCRFDIPAVLRRMKAKNPPTADP